jgi:tRNA A-37 threonylcarbamoyl transferase component Bud32
MFPLKIKIQVYQQNGKTHYVDHSLIDPGMTVLEFIEEYESALSFTPPAFRGSGRNFSKSKISTTSSSSSSSSSSSFSQTSLPFSTVTSSLPNEWRSRMYCSGKLLHMTSTFDQILEDYKKTTPQVVPFFVIDMRPLFPFMKIAEFSDNENTVIIGEDKYKLLRLLSNCSVGGKLFSAIKIGDDDSLISRQQFVVKVCVKREQHLYNESKSRSEENPIREFAILQYLQQFQDRNIIPLYDIAEDQDIIYAVMRYCSNDFFTKIKASYETDGTQYLKERDVHNILHGIASGIHTLHNASVSHGDLSAENICLDGLQPYIIDFGMSKYIVSATKDNNNNNVQEHSRFHGKSAYLAPECKLGNLHNPVLADMWAFGCICFLSLTGHVFDTNLNDSIYCHFIDNSIKKWIAQATNDDLMLPVSDSFIDFLERILIPFEPSRRLLSSECLKHKFLTPNLELLNP